MVSRTVPKYFLWLRYISWFSYANEILIINQWHNVHDIECPSNTTLCYRHGNDIIKSLDMDKVSICSYIHPPYPSIIRLILTCFSFLFKVKL